MDIKWKFPDFWIGFSVLNHPAIGVPWLWKPRKTSIWNTLDRRFAVDVGGSASNFRVISSASMSNNSCHGHCEAGIQLKVIESDDPKSKPSNHQTQSSFATNLGISSWKSWCLWPAMPWQAHLGPAPLLSFRRWVAPASALKNMLQTIIVCFSGSGVNISGLRVCVFNFLGVSFKESAWKPEFRKFLQIAAHRTKAYAPTHARVWGLNKWSCPV